LPIGALPDAVTGPMVRLLTSIGAFHSQGAWYKWPFGGYVCWRLRRTFLNFLGNIYNSGCILNWVSPLLQGGLCYFTQLLVTDNNLGSFVLGTYYVTYLWIWLFGNYCNP